MPKEKPLLSKGLSNLFHVRCTKTDSYCTVSYTGGSASPPFLPEKSGQALSRERRRCFISLLNICSSTQYLFLLSSMTSSLIPFPQREGTVLYLVTKHFIFHLNFSSSTINNSVILPLSKHFKFLNSCKHLRRGGDLGGCFIPSSNSSPGWPLLLLLPVYLRSKLLPKNPAKRQR